MNESKIAGFSSKTDKAGEQFEMAAKIFEAASGREIPVSEKTAQSAPSLPGYVSNQAAKGIVRAVNSNEKEIVIQIKPPELGRMQIKIETTDSGMNVQILAEKSIASDILGSNKADLAAYLAESGIKVNKLDIQLAFNFDQAMSSYKENAHQESGKRRNRRDPEDEAACEKSADNLEEIVVTDDRVSLTA